MYQKRSYKLRLNNQDKSRLILAQGGRDGDMCIVNSFPYGVVEKRCDTTTGGFSHFIYVTRRLIKTWDYMLRK